MAFPAGRLDRRIRFEKSVVTQDSDTGEEIHDYTTPSVVASRWARRRPLQAREQFTAQQFQAVAPVAYEVRWDSVTSTVTPKDRWRIVDQGRNYDIRAVTEIGRREGMTFIAEARAE